MTNELFNSKGELNAGSSADAINKIVAFAQAMQNGVTPLETRNASVNDDAREALLVKAMQSERGKIALAQAMANPIRRNLDYQGVGRKALRVDPLPQGALPVYDKDIDVSATVISSNGAVPESRIKGERISVPEFEIVSNPTVRIYEVKRRRFNVIDRAQQIGRAHV